MLKELLMLFFQEGLICVSDRVILLQVVSLFVLWWAWPVSLALRFPCTQPQYYSDIGCVRISGRSLVILCQVSCDELDLRHSLAPSHSMTVTLGAYGSEAVGSRKSKLQDNYRLGQRPRCKKNRRHKLRNPLDSKKRFLFSMCISVNGVTSTAVSLEAMPIWDNSLETEVWSF